MTLVVVFVGVESGGPGITVPGIFLHVTWIHPGIHSGGDSRVPAPVRGRPPEFFRLDVT